ncbi:MAG: 3-hydroxyacyl-CoA dehydrogenase NAD-binding domain-containing protein [Alphaproteobacteria bacterium]|nr:3-hydroxyacyl-CoA dehydrogenase NAD-binding domain-containing protein [Alphaproteobacteria bacterium]
MDVKQVAVIGSGVMGSQIAAHITNAGVPVLLLDIVPKDAADRSALAKGALEKLKAAEPSTFMHPGNAKLITPGNLEDDLGKLRDADWIVEAVLENPQVKSDLYKKIDGVRKMDSIVSSNTSTIPLSVLIKGQSDVFAKDFLITHFFNPLRYMRLLELVTGPKTRPDAAEKMRHFCDTRLGKGVIPCHDTPGFIANRLGMFWLQSAVNAAIDLDLTVEEADEVCGKPMGIPKTGVFGLLDLIGIDLMLLIGKSLVGTLPANDPYSVIYHEPPLFQKMIADGYTGRKGKGGFYRFAKTEKGKVKESLNLKTGEYAPSQDSNNPVVAAAGKNLRALCDTQDKIGNFAWRVLSETLSYAFQLVPATVADITAVDEAMRLGYNWQWGPFELIDQLGAGWMMQRLIKENRPVPELLRKAADKSFYRAEGKLEFLALEGSYEPVKRPQGVLLLSDVKLAGKPMLSNASAAVWNIGDGVLCFEFTSKANAIDADILTLLDKTRNVIGDGRGAFKGLVIYNEGTNFSVGANIGFFLDCIKNAKWAAIEGIIKQGQAAYHALRFAPFPVVAAPMGMALGGGCEITLHCAAVQAYTEAYLGLVEANVGLIPGWGGCTQMLGRAYDARDRSGNTKPAVNQAFETISAAKVSKTAADAMDLQYLRPTDGITINKDRLLYDAKDKVLHLARDYHPPEVWQFHLPGAAGRSALDLVIETARQGGKVSPHDETIWKALGAVLCGGDNPAGPLGEEQLMELECREFMRLIRTPESAARIEHMLNTGKPLKN